MPLLSVITINYNDAAGLEKTIQSVLGQTFRDLEYIVIDGGSTDGSKELIEKHSRSFSYWVSEKDGGIYNAQNKGILKASGTYCLFLNSGDYLAAPDVLEKVFAGSPDADIIYGDMYIDDGGAPVYSSQPDNITFEFLMYGTLWHPASFIKRALFSSLGTYDESLKITADYDFFLRAISCSSCSTKHVRVGVAVFNTRGIGSSSATAGLHKAERNDVQLRYFKKEEIESGKKKYSRSLPWRTRMHYWLNAEPGRKKVADVLRKMLGR